MSSGAAYNKVKDLCYVRRQKPEVITREEYIDDEICYVVFDDIGKKFYKLHGNAWRIWDMLDGHTTLQDIVEKLYLQHDGERKEIQSDVCKFIAKIGKKGLIKAAIKNRIPA